MKRTLFIFLMTGWLTAAQAEVTTLANSPRPNVLFILVDDLRPALGAYGDPLAITPQMDTLAARGRLFSRHHVQNAQCQQSRASLLSGLRPDSTGVHLLEDNLQTKLPGTIMLPQHFRDNGYRTAGISKVLHSTQYPSLNYSEGHQGSGVRKQYFQTSPIDKSGEEDAFLAEGNMPWQFRVYATERAPDADCTFPGSEIIGDRYRDGQNLIKAMAMLEQLSNHHDSTGQSFFLAVGFDKPHTPFNAPDTYWALYDGLTDDQFGFPASWTGERQVPAGTHIAALPQGGLNFYSEYNSTGGLRDVRDARIAKQGYYACVSWIDDLVGRLLAKLSALGRDNDTIVVLWGDHGYHLGDHNGFWEKHSNFEMATHAPLIIRVPGMGRPGVPADAIVETVDIFPTLCDLAGLPYPTQPTASGQLEGTSLVPLLQDPQAPFKKAAISQRHATYNGGQVMRYAYRTDRYRYVAWYARPDLYNPATMGSTIVYEELYDYETDPEETVNQAAVPAYAGVMDEFRTIALQGRGWHDRRIAAGNPAIAPDFDSWAAVYAPFIHAPWNPAAHYDNDPSPAAIQYLFGTHPLQDGDAVPTILRRKDGALVYRFPAPLSRADFSLAVRGTADLAGGSWTANGVALEASSEVPGMIDALFPVGLDAFFLRLEAIPK